MTYGFVTQRIINGKRFTLWRNKDNPRDELLVCGDEAVPVKVKECLSADLSAAFKGKKIKMAKPLKTKLKKVK